ncbi:MAG TPA: HNH endonuclease signature motif containing protein [bacterium]|nr:HNH endonuclease signature motif containing protein [bacterium]
MAWKIKIAFSEKKKKMVWSKHPDSCAYCLKEIHYDDHGKCQANPPETAWEIEHDVPETDDYWKITGKDPHNIDNLWPVCCDCNDTKDELWGYEYLDILKSEGIMCDEAVYGEILSIAAIRKTELLDE